jgi:heme/copper-type cytochrome/quinol oxidase subunit 2
MDINDWSFIKLKFNRTKQVEVKSLSNIGSLVIKQKRVKENTPVPLRIISEDADPLIAVKKGLAPVQPTLHSMGWLKDIGIDLSSTYDLIGQNRKHAELMNVQLSRRLLRTQRTLVLPAQTNLTLITNSYDVVHSWFIPSLGLKMDCVPGRSTHHSFYIDTPGFFYGQCAEICGRYHHHMPIRLCMLPFDHFLVWWHHFGLPKVLNLAQSSQEDLYVGPSKFFW